MSSNRENRLRRAMGLGPAPDPAGLQLRDGKVRWAPESERQAAFEAWHREGRRARLAAGIAYLPHRLYRARGRLLDRYDALRGAHALTQARVLRYRSHHIHRIGEADDIEGYFDFGHSVAYRLDILTPRLLQTAAHEEWEQSNVLDAQRTWFSSSAPCLLVPCDTLDDELIAEAIARWYRRRFEFKRGHWSHRQGRVPTIQLDLAWEPPEHPMPGRD